MLKPKTRKTREDSEGKAAAIEDVRKEPVKRLNANVPASVYQQLQIKAAQEGRAPACNISKNLHIFFLFP